jgi:hypothetical protein
MMLGKLIKFQQTTIQLVCVIRSAWDMTYQVMCFFIFDSNTYAILFSYWKSFWTQVSLKFSVISFQLKYCSHPIILSWNKETSLCLPPLINFFGSVRSNNPFILDEILCSKYCFSSCYPFWVILKGTKVQYPQEKEHTLYCHLIWVLLSVTEIFLFKHVHWAPRLNVFLYCLNSS